MSKSRARCGDKIEPQHKPGVPSSMDEPVSGAQPNKIACPECGKTFNVKAEMERHRENTHQSRHG
jgi:predicted RNA-binding Zn-ribbon protein involved in translation (DUF1610 family)